ncbi:MAG: phosphonate metabolism protein/1,5-bisphosphokinase (PRPP-forming) PhnN, partial [Alphaproteobacteria bacterium]
ILALRLAGRGRETQDEIRQRLSRTVKVPVGDAVHINNDGPLADAVAQFVARLRRPEADGE